MSKKLLFYIAIYGYLRITYASIDRLPVLKNGDLVFQTIKSSQTLAIMLASKSPYTHVSIIKLDLENNPYVVEAVGPVREVALEDWIEQGVAGRITVMRFKKTGVDKIEASLLKAEEYYGRPYDFFFLFDKDRIYCSELVYYAFRKALALIWGRFKRSRI